MEQLARRVERLYLQADTVFPSDQMSTISVCATVNQNHPFGKTLEIVSTTPMKCSLQKANDTLWNWFSKQKALRNEPNTIERSYTLEFKSDIGTLEFMKQNFVRSAKRGYASVKMKLETFCTDAGLALPWEDVLKDMNKMIAEAYMLANLHAIRS
ncbi:hypothetical protein BBP00_00009736 [Phytophthora kernoviae]|uniref:Uncharacterized protein n=1 Tax=Phytophthora kernoviae TaxID=325452 RepID=A0A3F2RBW9_9STRA|nr:hypothetical protein BBP00_00009736 [Phytophthora kernoviae]